MLALLEDVETLHPEKIQTLFVREAQIIADEDVEINRQMGRNGAELLPETCTVIHHCNTGALATVDYGTALGVIRCAHEMGKQVHVLVDETRPRLQGARLTTWELEQYGIPYEIITDNAAGYHLASGIVDAVLVGADRVAANGDVANKIGTYMLALAARDNSIPFYVVSPTSTIDLGTQSGKDIPIEQRDPSEVLNLKRDNQPIAPAGARARNPAFDITPHTLISAIVTEVCVLEPPYKDNLRDAVVKGKS
jgi:methylthioribose-1-phosphate isomerase